MPKTEKAAAEAKAPAKSRKKTAARKETAAQSGTDTNRKFWKLIYDENSGTEEQLDKVAVIDNERPYTFRQLFRRWESYAEVFTGLGITEASHARLGIMMTPGVAALCAIYGANMIGVSVSAVSEMDLTNIERITETIKKEAITDIILDCSFIRPNVLRQIMRRKEECGLNHVILVPPENKVTKLFNRMMKEMQDMNYRQLKRIPGVLDMHAQLVRYEATPIVPSTTIDDTAYIVHTSGTTKGIHKPIPLSDIGVNETARRILDDSTFDKLRGGAILFGGFLSSAYHTMYQINMPLAAGCTVVFIPMMGPNPKLYKIIKEYQITLIVSAPIFFQSLLYPYRNEKDFDLSSIEYIVLGGEYISGKRRKEYNDFIAEKGGHAKVAVGYGLSEVGGAAILSAPGVETDAIGYPMLGVKARILDETDNKFYDVTEGQRSGGLYICSTSNSSGVIGDTRFFETETIDGEEYICTYDRVTVNEDGSLTCHGRMNRFFINNEGIKFNAGLIEVSLDSEPDIEECALVPDYSKELHDTIPALYVKAAKSGLDARRAVEKALYSVFVKDHKAEETNLPSKCVICEELPHNNSGKVDIYQIINDGLKGENYAIIAVRFDGAVKDVKLIPEEAAMLNPGRLPEEMEEEFKRYTLPIFKEMENNNKQKGDKKKMPKFKEILPMMGCNPMGEADEAEQNPYDGFRKSFPKPQMGCNPMGEADEAEQNPYDGFRKSFPKPQMSCNPMGEADEAEQNPYDGFRKSFRKPQMGCNPFAMGEEDEEDQPKYDGFRKPKRKPRMSCNPQEDADEDAPSMRYDQTRFPFPKPRMGCNPFAMDDEDDD